ncbi:hypothetical protein [Bacteroides sp. AF25-38AC]|nr:hypothetical protein [Bacteroides sp. AF25-38AC]
MAASSKNPINRDCFKSYTQDKIDPAPAMHLLGQLGTTSIGMRQAGT